MGPQKVVLAIQHFRVYRLRKEETEKNLEDLSQLGFLGKESECFPDCHKLLNCLQQILTGRSPVKSDAMAVCRTIRRVVKYLGIGVLEMAVCSWRQSAGNCNLIKTFCRRRGGEVQIEEM